MLQEDDALWDILAAPRLQPDTLLRRAADEATWQACIAANTKIGVMVTDSALAWLLALHSHVRGAVRPTSRPK